MTQDDALLRLIAPNVEFEESHRSFLKQFQERGDRVHPSIAARPFDNFAEYVAMLSAESRGENIPSNWVANSTYWLVDADNEIVAISNMRHELNDFLLTYGGHIGYGVRPSARKRGHGIEILKQTLLMAKGKGIHRVRVTCAKDNPASEKTILHNGGVFDDEAVMAEHDEVLRRYWIIND